MTRFITTALVTALLAVSCASTDEERFADAGPTLECPDAAPPVRQDPPADAAPMADARPQPDWIQIIGDACSALCQEFAMPELVPCFNRCNNLVFDACEMVIP